MNDLLKTNKVKNNLMKLNLLKLKFNKCYSKHKYLTTYINIHNYKVHVSN